MQCEQIALIQDDNDRPPLRQQCLERLELGLGNVTVEHKDNEIGPPRNFPGELLAIFTTGFVEPGCIDQEYAAGLEFAPLLHRRMPGFAMQRADRECLFADQCIEE